MPIDIVDVLSWRDPSGFVVSHDGRILRAVKPGAQQVVERVLHSPWFTGSNGQIRFPNSRWVAAPDCFGNMAREYLWLEHEVVPLPCYPHEITPLQLYDSGALTLRIAKEALKDDLLLKDASAWNVLFSWGKPTFCDVLSFEVAGDLGIWRPYAQFCRNYLIPLLIYQRCNVPTSSLFLSYRDGVNPEQAWPILRGLSLFSQPMLDTVTLPRFLRTAWRPGFWISDPNAHKKKLSEMSRYLLARIFDRLETQLDKVKPSGHGHKGEWTNYESNRFHYSNDDINEKRQFVHRFVSSAGVMRVLDIGSNTGEFSKIAADAGKDVVSADTDICALERLYSECRLGGRHISPIVLDIARPTPAVGWMNMEVPSFIHRAAGNFDCVLMLGLIHHMLVTERAALAKIAALLDNLASKLVIVEWVSPNDVKFREIAGPNLELYANLTELSLMEAMSEKFELVETLTLSSASRALLAFKRRPPVGLATASNSLQFPPVSG